MPPRPLRVARYLRVSTKDQNLDLQRDETDALIGQRGWDLVETYEDHAVSGTKDRRPALDRMLADARRGRFGCVLVWRSDRLFRSLKHLITTVHDLGELNVSFVSCTEVFDTQSASGRLHLHLLGAMGEFERALIAERSAAGVAAARRRGVRLGRPRAQFDLDRAIELRAAGQTYKTIATTLGVSVGVIHAALRAERVREVSSAAPRSADGFEPASAA
mgnify:CR=1 FL=1